MRYYLIDKITEYVPKTSITGVKAITLTDPILHDHFPDNPILPGALILEGMAQLSGFLLEATFNKSGDKIKRALFVQADKLKFKKLSTPGELLTYHAEITSLLDDGARIKVKATCNGELRSQGVLTFHMAEIDSKNLTEERINIYKIWTKELKNCPPLR